MTTEQELVAWAELNHIAGNSIDFRKAKTYTRISTIHTQEHLVLCGHVWRRGVQRCKKRSCSGIFTPGCEGPWMLIQECVLLGLVLSYNYGVEHKYQAHLVPWDVKNIRSNLPSKSLEAQIPQVLCQITACCLCTCDFCFTRHHQIGNWDSSQVFTASTTTK